MGRALDSRHVRNCATALHQLAKRTSNQVGEARVEIVGADEALHALLAARTAAVMAHEQSDVTPRSLTSIVWAMGKLRLFDPNLRKQMVSHAHSQLARGLLDPFGIANVAWALATLHQHAASASSETVNTSEIHATLLDALATRACEVPRDFKPQEMCNLLWACT